MSPYAKLKPGEKLYDHMHRALGDRWAKHVAAWSKRHSQTDDAVPPAPTPSRRLGAIAKRQP